MPSRGKPDEEHEAHPEPLDYPPEPRADYRPTDPDLASTTPEGTDDVGHRVYGLRQPRRYTQRVKIIP
jgi:hypothetical protein